MAEIAWPEKHVGSVAGIAGRIKYVRDVKCPHCGDEFQVAVVLLDTGRVAIVTDDELDWQPET